MTLIQPSSTATNIISYVRSRCRLGTNPPNAAFQETQMLLALNDVNEWFWFWPTENSLSPWKIARKRKLFTTIASTTLNGAVSANATSLILTSATDFDSPGGTDVGAGYVKNNQGIYILFNYETKSSNTLSSVSGIDVALTSGWTVFKHYPLPIDFDRPRQLKVDGQTYKFTDSEFDDIPPPGCYMTRYEKSTNGYDKFFLILPDNMQSDRTLQFNYVRKPTTISAGTHKVDAPDGVARWALIEKFKAYVWGERGETELAAIADQKAEKFIQQYAATKSNEDASENTDPTFDLE